MKQSIVYLVRHGEIATDGNKRYIGQLDLPLNDKGELQAARLREELASVPFSRIFCSDLVRSVATARIICGNHDLEPVVIGDLREINMGFWEGLTFEEVRLYYPCEFEKRGSDIVEYQPPGGESFARCARRIMSALDDILAAASGNILIAGHAGINRIIISRALGMPLENIFRISQDYGCLNILISTDLGLRVKTLNHTFGTS
jgi:probable phosphoglycerate mutase